MYYLKLLPTMSWMKYITEITSIVKGDERKHSGYYIVWLVYF